MPISGGLDSRLILAALLENIESKQISTYSFGEPGSLDFEIGCKVAKTFGTRHTAIDLSRLEVDESTLLYDSEMGCGQTMLFHSTPFAILKSHYGDDVTYWSGFMGDPIAGSKLSVEVMSEQIDRKAIDGFVAEQTIAFPEVSLSDSSYAELSCPTDSRLTVAECLNFYNRQGKYIAPHVVPTSSYISPLFDIRWVETFLSLGLEDRLGCRFYQKFCQAAFPDFFENIGVKANAGLTLSAPRWQVFGLKALNRIGARAFSSIGYRDRALNYFDLERRLESDPIFRRLFLGLVQRGLALAKKAGAEIRADSFQNRRLTVSERVILASLAVHEMRGGVSV